VVESIVFIDPTLQPAGASREPHELPCLVDNGGETARRREIVHRRRMLGPDRPHLKDFDGTCIRAPRACPLIKMQNAAA
jgi:hypothetical protein